MIKIELTKKALLYELDEKKLVLETQKYLKAKLINKNIDLEIDFVTPSVIHDLNLKYCKRDKVTDVLSFPIYQNSQKIINRDYVHLGSIVLNTKGIKRESDSSNVDFTKQCIFLVTHSVDHLLGKHHKE